MEGIGSYRRVGAVAGLVLFLGAWMAGYYSFKALAAVIAIGVVLWLIYVWSRDRVQDTRLYAEAFVMGAFAVVVARALGLFATWIVHGRFYVPPAQNYAIPGNWLDFFRIILNGTFGQLLLAMLVGGAAAVLATYIAALLDAADDDEEEVAEDAEDKDERKEKERWAARDARDENADRKDRLRNKTDDDKDVDTDNSDDAADDDEAEDEEAETERPVRAAAVKAAPSPVKNSSDLQQLRGMTPSLADKLNNNGIMGIEDLVEQAGTPEERKSLAQACGISSGRVLRWVNMADLMRIKGVSADAADLLEKAGVDSVVELGVRSPERLLAKLENTNKSESVMDLVPELDVVQKWVERAKELPRKVTHESGVRR